MKSFTSSGVDGHLASPKWLRSLSVLPDVAFRKITSPTSGTGSISRRPTKQGYPLRVIQASCNTLDGVSVLQGFYERVRILYSHVIVFGFPDHTLKDFQAT